MLNPLDPDLIQLSLHQKLALRAIEQEIPKMSRQQLEEYLLQVAHLAESRQAVIRALMKTRGGA